MERSRMLLFGAVAFFMGLIIGGMAVYSYEWRLYKIALEKVRDERDNLQQMNVDLEAQLAEINYVLKDPPGQKPKHAD
jgi:hypothetical protein